MSSLISTMDRTGFFLLTVCVVLGPIPFGSNDAGLVGLIGMLLSVAILGSLIVPVASVRARRLLGATMVLATFVILISLFQSIPWIPTGWANPTWAKTSELIDGVSGSISATRYQPLHSVGYVLVPLAAFMSSLIYIRDRERYMTFMRIVLGCAIIVALLCIAQHISAPATLLWSEKKYYLDSFTGTFVNANSAATYFGLLLLMSIAMVFGEFGQVDAGRNIFLDQSLRASDRKRVRSVVIYSIFAFVFGVALLLTKSRAGVFSTVIGVIIFTSAAAFLGPWRQASLIKVAGAFLASMLGLLCVFSLYGERLARRLEEGGVADVDRVCTYESTWNSIKDNFWWGAGLGTFQDVYPGYRTLGCGLDGYWEMAHSVFLEAWMGLGLAFIVCGIIVYVGLIATYVRGLRNRYLYRFVPLMCLGLLIIVTIHSLVDFSLQIPAVAILVAAVLGAGASVSLAGSRRQGSAI